MHKLPNAQGFRNKSNLSIIEWQAGERARQDVFGESSPAAEPPNADRPISDEELLKLIDLAQESLTSPQGRPSRREFLDEVLLRLAA